MHSIKCECGYSVENTKNRKIYAVLNQISRLSHLSILVAYSVPVHMNNMVSLIIRFLYMGFFSTTSTIQQK